MGYRRWVCGLLAALCVLLLGCGGMVYAVDPCLYYRLPADGTAVFFNERYQNAGLARNQPADTVLLGTSMVANYRASHVAAAYGGTAAKLTVPDGYLSEFTAVLDQVFQNGTPERVLFGLDINILLRDESGLTGALPAYLYDKNPLNDVQYLLNKDTLYYSAYTLLEKHRGTAQPLDDAFTWDADTWWNHMTALDNYERPEQAAAETPQTAYLQNAHDNAQVLLAWAQRQPQTQFEVFFTPYSLLYWDKAQRQGETAAVLAAVDLAVRDLLEQAPPNLRLTFLTGAKEIVADLDYYGDYIHHSGEAGDRALELLRDGSYTITEKNWGQVLSTWQEFVVHYQYDQFWTDAFWWKWNIERGAPIVWKPGT